MKRGSSGLSFLLGIDKAQNMSSHDVVNRVRGIYNEKRVGHTGTLDPLASGALLVCVGPATRLSSFLVLEDKSYVFRISFGASTDTDDAQGQVILQSDVPQDIYDKTFAASHVAALKGPQQQVPPAFSAVKVDGQRSYTAARKGISLELKARDIEVYEASLVGLGSSDDDTEFESAAARPFWDVELRVSKGSYIRSLARDLGKKLGVPAHVSRLRRLSIGSLNVCDCLSLSEVPIQGDKAFLDPVALLGFRVVCLDASMAADVVSGKSLSSKGVSVFEALPLDAYKVSGIQPVQVRKSSIDLKPGEKVSFVYKNTLAALYQFDEQLGLLKPRCVFSTGVSCGRDYSN